MQVRFGARQNWESLRVFASCARYLSFTRAAEELGLTQAAVSQRIRQLEDRLQQKLFVRMPRLALTPVGARLAPSIANAFAAIDRGLSEAGGERGLCITTTLTIASAWLVPRLGSFIRSHPRFRVALDVTDDVRSLDDPRFDVAIRTGEGRWAGIESELLFPIRLTPTMSPELARRSGAPRAEALKRVPLLPDRAWSDWFRSGGERPPSSFDLPSISVNSQILSAEAAAAGEGVALLSPRFVAHHVAAGRLVQPFKRTIHAGDYFLAWLKERRAEEPVAMLRKWLKAEITRAH